MCKHCQKHANALNRFRFKFQDNIDFNYTLLINIIQFKKRDMFHIINEAIGFKAARLIRKGAGLITAKVMFNAFKSA